MEEQTIFTKIIRGEIPCHKVYEDENTIAFLDIHPANVGHTLVVSKTPEPYVWDLSSGDYQNLMDSTKKIASRIREILNPDYIAEMVIGIDVRHAHVHLIPFSSTVDLEKVFDIQKPEPDHETLSKLADRLKF